MFKWLLNIITGGQKYDIPVCEYECQHLQPECDATKETRESFFACTRSKDHKGNHIACDDKYHALAEWISWSRE